MLTLNAFPMLAQNANLAICICNDRSVHKTSQSNVIDAATTRGITIFLRGGQQIFVACSVPIYRGSFHGESA